MHRSYHEICGMIHISYQRGKRWYDTKSNNKKNSAYTLSHLWLKRMEKLGPKVMNSLKWTLNWRREKPVLLNSACASWKSGETLDLISPYFLNYATEVLTNRSVKNTDGHIFKNVLGGATPTVCFGSQTKIRVDQKKTQDLTVRKSRKSLGDMTLSFNKLTNVINSCY